MSSSFEPVVLTTAWAH